MRGWFGHFRIERQVGRGGLGAVYRAVDTRSNSTVALKLLPPGPDPVAGARLHREFAALQQVQHPNVVRVLDAGTVEDVLWLEMEFVEGLPLREWLSICSQPTLLEPDERPSASEGVDLDALFDDEPDSGALLAAARARQFPTDPSGYVPLDDAEQAALNDPARLSALCEALAQVCDGLKLVHDRGLVHRDVKPSNILVTPARRAILVDFGLVKLREQSQITDAGRVVGTYRYMSPEQAKGEPVDHRSDLYAVGATLYELLTSRPPFTQQGQMQLLQAVVLHKPVPIGRINAGAPRTLCALAEQLLAKAPGDRPSDAGEVATMLRAVSRTVGRAAALG
jgi:serine/threonine protein kinase